MKDKKLFGIGISIFLLGMASFFADVSSEIINPVLPLFATALGASSIIIGFLGGLSEAVASIFRIYSGYLSDKWGKRKRLIILGYGTSSMAKLFLSMSVSWLQILVFKPIERIGKGMREPPRDALVAETTDKKIHGKIFGILRTMDTSGAVIGAIIAFLFLWLIKLDFRTTILIAGAVSFIALIPLFFVKDSVKKPEKEKLETSIKDLPRNFKIFIMIIAVFSLADFSYMFYILKAQEITKNIYIPVLLYALYHLVYAIFAVPFGILSDKIGKKKVLNAGYFVFATTLIGFSLFSSLAWIVFLFMLYGLANSMIVGTERAFASELIKKKFGVAFGTFHTVLAIIALPASLLAGFLWQFNSSLPFLISAGIVTVAAILLVINKDLEV